MGQKKTKKTLFTVLEIFFVLVFLAGACVFLYPFVREQADEQRTDDLVTQYNKMIKEIAQVETPAEDENRRILTELWDVLQQYNERLSTDGQAGMRDIFSYEHFAVDITKYEFPDNVFGYLEIPAIGRTYPLYLGASRENLAKGATVLGESSAPIGGANTHCVIAAHNYWAGAEQFRKIRTLKVGDYVYVTNPWGTLTYRVINAKEINPDDFSGLYIQNGKDLLTLFTCTADSQHRWCVYCERVEE